MNVTASLLIGIYITFELLVSDVLPFDLHRSIKHCNIILNFLHFLNSCFDFLFSWTFEKSGAFTITS